MDETPVNDAPSYPAYAQQGFSSQAAPFPGDDQAQYYALQQEMARQQIQMQQQKNTWTITGEEGRRGV